MKKKLTVLFALLLMAVALCACQPKNSELESHMDTIQQLQEQTLHRVEALEREPEF